MLWLSFNTHFFVIVRNCFRRSFGFHRQPCPWPAFSISLCSFFFSAIRRVCAREEQIWPIARRRVNKPQIYFMFSSISPLKASTSSHLHYFYYLTTKEIIEKNEELIVFKYLNTKNFFRRTNKIELINKKTVLTWIHPQGFSQGPLTHVENVISVMLHILDKARHMTLKLHLMNNLIRIRI